MEKQRTKKKKWRRVGKNWENENKSRKKDREGMKITGSIGEKKRKK